MRRQRTAAKRAVSASVARQKNLAAMLLGATQDMAAAVVHAASLGVTHAELARITDLSEGRIWQLVNDWKGPNRKESK